MKISTRGYLDGVVALLLFISVFLVAVVHLRQVGLGDFYQSHFSPAIAWACTGKFESLNIAAPELAPVDSFIKGNSQSFDCKGLPAAPAYRVPLINFQYQTLYLIAAAAGIWAITGIKWGAILYLAALFAGAMSAAIYGICRLFVHIPAAAAATIFATLSPVNGIMLPQLRDYSKAPFLLGVILLCGWLLKSVGRSKQFIAAAALAGIVAGIGLGIRADLAMALPFFGITLSLSLIATRFKLYRDVFIAGVVFVVAFVGTASPILSAYRGGGVIGHVALLGLTTPFNAPFLGLSATPYDVGHLYLDESVEQFTEEFAFGRQLQPGDRPDAAAASDVSSADSSLTLEALMTYALHFPADMVIRAYSAALQTISLNFHAGVLKGFPDFLLDLRSALTYQSAALPLLFLFAAFVAWSSMSLATFLIFTFAYFAGIGALQFHYRHVFYLEFLYWLSLFGLIAGCGQVLGYVLFSRRNFRWRVAIRSFFVALAVPSAALAASIVLIMALRAFQNFHVHSLMDRYLTASRKPVRLAEDRTGNEILLRPTGEVPGMSGVTVNIEQTPFEGYYFDAIVDSGRCPSFSAKITYKLRPNATDISRPVNLVSSQPGNGHIIFPVMNWPRLQELFEGITINTEQRPCFLDLMAVADYKSLPLPLWLQLPPNWPHMKLYQTQLESSLPFSH